MLHQHSPNRDQDRLQSLPLLDTENASRWPLQSARKGRRHDRTSFFVPDEIADMSSPARCRAGRRRLGARRAMCRSVSLANDAPEPLIAGRLDNAGHHMRIGAVPTTMFMLCSYKLRILLSIFLSCLPFHSRILERNEFRADRWVGVPMSSMPAVSRAALISRSVEDRLGGSHQRPQTC